MRIYIIGNDGITLCREARVPFLIAWLGVIRLPSRSKRRPVSRLAW
jgi:hypothetical protein